MTLIQIQWTCENIAEAREITKELLEKNLVAYANIFPEVESMYLSNNEVQQVREVTVFFKTTEESFSAVKNFILARCSYIVPEITSTVIKDGNSNYMQWVQKVCK